MNNNKISNTENSISISYIHEEQPEYKRDFFSLNAKGDIVLPFILLSGVALGLLFYHYIIQD